MKMPPEMKARFCPETRQKENDYILG